MSMSRRATIAGFVVLVLGVIVLDAMWVGGGSKLADTRAPASSSATGGRSYDKVCLVEMECDLGEICSKVVDRRFRKARGVPSREGNPKGRRANAGGKDTPLCSEYIRTRWRVKSSCSISTRSSARERGGCWPRHSKQRSKPISRRPKI